MRLNEIQKAEISAKLNGGVSGNHLAKEYGVAKSTISLLRKRKYDEMSQKSATFNRASSGSIQSEDASYEEETTANESSDNDEIVEKKSRIFPAYSQLKLYKPSQGIDEHNDDETDSEYEDKTEDETEHEQGESEEEDEDDSNEICRKLQRICDNLLVPVQSLRAMFKLISKLQSRNLLSDL